MNKSDEPDSELARRQARGDDSGAPSRRLSDDGMVLEPTVATPMVGSSGLADKGGSARADSTNPYAGGPGSGDGNKSVEDDALQPAIDPMVGTELGGCRIEALIGRGAMGAVYRARQISLDRVVAVKVLRPDLVPDRRIIRRFDDEAKNVGRFNTPHVVMIHDVGTERGLHFIVMEYVPGKNLRDYVKAMPNKRIDSDEEAVRLLRHACEGLKEAQRLGVLHRDIKPDNLMLDERGSLKIADFGISKRSHEDFGLTAESDLMGTPMYMSPEQCRAAKDLDFRSDMYSLGATFFYLLTGQPPINAESISELYKSKTTAACLYLWSGLPSMAKDHPLSRVIEKMTALDRAHRYGSYDEILEDLNHIVAGRKKFVRPRPDAPMPAPVEEAWKHRHRRGLLGVAILLVLVGGFALIKSWPPNGVIASPSPDSIVAIRAELDSIKDEFLKNGSLPDLKKRIDAIVIKDDALEREKAELLADLTTANDVQASLDEVNKARPVTPRVPFKDIEEFYSRVDAAVAAPAGARPYLAKWLDEARAKYRSESSLGDAAARALTDEWQRFQAGGGDLRPIEDAYAHFLSWFPSSKTALPAELGEGLKKPRFKVDLDQLEKRAETETLDAALLERTREIAVQLHATSFTDLAERADALLAAVDRLRRVSDRLLELGDLPSDAPPLRMMFRRKADLKALFEPQIPDAMPLALRFRGERDGRTKDLYAHATRCFETDLATRESQLADFQSRRLAASDWIPAVEALRECVGFFDTQPLPEQVLRRLETLEVQAKSRNDVAVALRTLRERTEKALGNVDADAHEASRVGALSATLDSMRADLDEILRRDPVAGSDPDVLRVRSNLDELVAIREKLTASNAETILAAEVLGLLLERKLAVARKRLDERPKLERPELRALLDVCKSIDEAVEALTVRLDLTDGERALQSAAKALTSIGSSPESIKLAANLGGFRARAEELIKATATMAPVRGGNIRYKLKWLDHEESQDIDGYFLDACETSQGDYQYYVDRLSSAEFEKQSRQVREAFTSEEAFRERRETAKANLQANKDRLNSNSGLPVANISFNAALDYLRVSGKDLPELAEWWLAAHGDSSRIQRKFPWGPQWGSDIPYFSLERLVAVEYKKSGCSVDFELGGRRVPVYHLAGNVAEWTRTLRSASKGYCVAGGSFRNARENKYFSGEEVACFPPTTERDEVGFRGVIRPAEFLRDFLPKKP